MKSTTIALALTAALATGAAHAQTSDIFSTSPIFKRVVSSTTATTTSSTTFTDLVTRNMYVPRGVDALVTARFSAESRCTEPGSVATNWCEVRILIGGVEAEPVETVSGQDFAFDGTDSGNAASGDFESHSMDRHRCVRNAGGATTLVVPVVVQWAVTNLDAGTAPSFWIDDYTLTIEANAGCYTVP